MVFNGRLQKDHAFAVLQRRKGKTSQGQMHPTFLYVGHFGIRLHYCEYKSWVYTVLVEICVDVLSVLTSLVATNKLVYQIKLI